MKFEEYNEIVFNRIFKILDKEPSLHDWEMEERQRRGNDTIIQRYPGRR